MKRIFLMIVTVTMVAAAASADEAADLLRADVKAGRLAAMMLEGHGSAPAPVQQLHANNPYRVGIGVFGAYEPSVFPNQTWIDIACFGQPGRSYPGSFSLMYVDVYLYRSGRRVWSSTTRGNDRGICDISRGVDTTFVEIPRSLRFTSWRVFVTSSERHRRGVATGGFVYRRDPLPSWCDRRDCEDATVRYLNPAHIYR